ncbi:MAG: MmgE/PrpD family protein [Usitatibacter sp.]
MTDTHASALRAIHDSLAKRELPERARATARLGMLDVIGCIVGGAPTETAARVREFAAAQASEGAASVLGSRERYAAPIAALVNGVAGHVLDYDDMNSTMIGHPSVVLVPSLLAIAETRHRSGADLLRAYVLGFEVNGHFGRAMVPTHYNNGWHSTSSLGIFGATAGASFLLGLDSNAMLNALAIAASNSAGLRANFGSMTKSLHAGQAAEGAVRAALLSASGFTANADVFDSPTGYFATYARGASPGRGLAAGELEIEKSGIGIKPYACCGAGISVIDAALDIGKANLFEAKDIELVEVTLSTMAQSIMPFHSAANGLQARYCHEYCAAVALIDGRGGLAQFDDARVLRDDVQQLLKRTSVTVDPKMPVGGGLFPVVMKVKLRDGRTLDANLEVPRGHPTRPVEPQVQLEKFLECAAPVVGESRAREAARRLGAIEDEATLGPLVNLLRR